MMMSSYLIQAITHQTAQTSENTSAIGKLLSPAGQRVPLVGRLPLYGELQWATHGNSGLERLRRFLTCSTPASGSVRKKEHCKNTI